MAKLCPPALSQLDMRCSFEEYFEGDLLAKGDTGEYLNVMIEAQWKGWVKCYHNYMHVEATPAFKTWWK